MSTTRKSYPSDASDTEWEFLVSYLTLMREDAPQREHSLRELFDALRYLVKTGCPWRFLPNDFPPGPRFISRLADGSRPASSSKPLMTCASSCDSSRAATINLRP